ncbi:8581_t:CDS:2, partial [Acaulospora morrowiae]
MKNERGTDYGVLSSNQKDTAFKANKEEPFLFLKQELIIGSCGRLGQVRFSLSQIWSASLVTENLGFPWDALFVMGTMTFKETNELCPLEHTDS